MIFATYLINLDGSDLRLQSAREQLAAEGLDFKRVPAFDGRNLAVADFPQYDAQKSVAYMGRPLCGGEIGCFLSHLDCASRFLESDEPYALVLEDDMQLTQDFAQGVQHVTAWLNRRPVDWHLINIGANRHKIFTLLTDFAIGDRHHLITRAHYFPMTTSGLIWSRAGAAAFLAEHQTIFCPIDNWFRHWLARNDRGLAVWPPLVTTTGADSEISGQNAPKRSAAGRHFLYGFIKQKRLMTDKILALRHKWQRRTS